MVALEEEIGTPIEITGIYWYRGLTGGSSVEFDDFHVYMGYCAGDSLQTSFEENWLAGSRIHVFQREMVLLEVFPAEWFGFQLDSSFTYDGSGDLLFEVRWTGGRGSLQTFIDNQDPPYLCLKASTSTSSSGYITATRCQFMLEGTIPADPME